MSERRPPTVGEFVADGVYRIQSTLGGGGMGVVYRAWDTRLDRPVALKWIRPGLLTGDHRAQFLEEARAMARVRHPNVTAVYSFGFHEGEIPYIAMEFIGGRTLRHWIDENPHGLPVDVAVGLLDQLCSGTQAIHDAGLLHGDLKPENVIVGPAFRVAVTDFGLSAGLGAVEGRRAGTAHYVAPELADGRELVPAQATLRDVYSLGVVAYEALTGQPPFDGESVEEVLRAHLAKPIDPPSERRPGLSRAFDRAILAAMAKRPELRTESANYLRRSLAKAQLHASSGGGGYRVVLADDDEDFRILVEAILATAFPDATFVHCSNGTEAVRAVDAGHTDLVVMDLNMPDGVNGLEAAAAIRASERSAETPLLVATGEGGAGDWKVLQSIGADGFLVKPIDPTSLVASARRLMMSRG